ncbi:MAG: hypothetical protein JKY56_01815 [Kofleriaceae bacterium]|nr:hypothetical protein [Kofleriaceae bacterium]
MESITSCSEYPSCGRLVLWPDMDLLSSDLLLWYGGCETAVELADDVRAAVVSELSPRQRQVVEGCFFEGLSQPQLSAKLGISQQVIHKCLYGTRREGKMVGGALKKLRGALCHLVRR